MATREGILKIILKAGSFQAGLNRMKTSVDQAGRQMGTALKEPMNKGISSVKDSMSSMLDDLKGGLKTAATLGGALSAGAMIKSAVTMRSKYVALSHTISQYSGEVVKAADVQKTIERVANETGTTFEELALTMNALEGIPGGLKIIGPTLERATMQAKRMGMNAEYVAQVYSRVMTKGLASTGKEAEILTEKFAKFGRTVLGVDVDEAIDKMDVSEFASFANRVGADTDQLMMLLGSASTEVKDFGQSLMFLEEMGDALGTVEGLNKLRKETKLSKNEINMSNDAVENLLTVMEKKGPKAYNILNKALKQADTQKMFREMVGKELAVQIDKGEVKTEDWDIRVEELRKQLEEAKNSAFDYDKIIQTDIQLKKSAQADMNRALNNLTAALSTPKLIKSINSLAENLPVLAEKLAGLIAWVVENPGTAAINFLLLKVGAVFVGSAVKSAAAAGMTKVMGILATQATVAAAGAKAGLGVGAIGAGAVTTAVTGGAVAAGAAAYFTGFKGIIEPEMEADFARLDSINDTIRNLRGVTEKGTLAQKKAAVEQVKSRMKMLEEGPSFITKMAGIAGDKGATELFEEKAEALRKAQERLIKSMDSMSGAASTAGDSLKKVQGGADNASSRGPKTKTKPSPGATGTEG